MTTMDQILVIERKATLHESLAHGLELRSGILVLQVATGEQALKVIKGHSVAVILIDVDPPDIDGCQLCRLMRRQGVKTPIMLLSANDTDADLILGLDSGASDYITKPFRFDMLLARLRVQLRRYGWRELPHMRAPGGHIGRSEIPGKLGPLMKTRVRSDGRLEPIEGARSCYLPLKAD